MTTAELRDKAERFVDAIDMTNQLLPSVGPCAFTDAADVCRAWLADHPAGAPDWYSEAEIAEWLRRQLYEPAMAKELAAVIARNYQLAFEKGFSMGKRAGE